MASVIEQILASPTTHSIPWRALVKEWWDAPPPTDTLERIGAIVESWPTADRVIESEEWDQIRRRDVPPFWWTWVRALTLTRGSTLAPARWLSGIVHLAAAGEYDAEDRLVGYSVENDLLAELMSLREISLQNNPYGFDLDLRRLPASVVSLDLSSAGLHRSLHWAGLSSIERLNLSGTRLDSLDGIEAMTRLVELDLSRCRSLPSLDPLRSLALRGLRLHEYWGCPLEPISALDTLEELDLGGAFAPVDLSVVARLPSLRRLELGGQGVQSLAPLHGASRSLIALDLDQVMTLAALDGLEGLSSLEEVRIRTAPCLGSLRPLSLLERLRSVSLEDPGSWQDLESLSACRDLRAVTLIDTPNGARLRSVDFLGALTGLRDLRLDLAALESLPALEGLRDLRALELRCPALKGVSALRGLPSLERLTLDDCENLCDLSPLADLPSLKELRVLGRTSGG